MPSLRFSRNAREDLRGITRYIARDKPIAARQWVNKIKAKCHLLVDHPQLGESREDLGCGIRCTYVGSYVVFYRPTAEAIEVVRVLRGDRDVRSI
jgi:toxin ParE1/3/4